MIKVALLLFALIAFAYAVPIFIEDVEGKHYYIEPVEEQKVLYRQKREEPKKPGPNDPKAFAEYNANSKTQGGKFSYRNPDGSGFDVGHEHSNGFGHTVSLDGRLPIWSNKNPYGESSLNLGVGATNHYGGWPGNMNLDKRVGLYFTHRF